MGSDAEEAAASTAASVSSGSGSDGGGMGVGAQEEEDVVVVEEGAEQQAADEEGDEEGEEALDEGWMLHSMCELPYDARVYEEYKGGKKGQAPSAVWAFCVRHRETKFPYCLICNEGNNSAAVPKGPLFVKFNQSIPSQSHPNRSIHSVSL